MYRSACFILLILTIGSAAIAQPPKRKALQPPPDQPVADAPEHLVPPYTGMIMKTTLAQGDLPAMTEGEVVDVIDKQDGKRLVVDEEGYQRWVKEDTVRSLPIAQQVMQAKLENTPKDYQTLFSLAASFHATGDFEQSLKFSDQLVKFHPNEVNVFVARSQLFSSMDRVQDAINAATHGLQIKKTTVLYVNRGFAYDKLGEFEKALDDYERALEINPEDVMALNNRGAVLIQQKKFDQAIRDFTVALRIHKVDFLYRGRGLAYRHSGNLDKAIADLTTAINVNPGNSKNYLSRGRTYFQMDQGELAKSDFSKALQFAPNDARTMSDLAATLIGMGENKKGLEICRRAIKLEPGFALAWSNQAVCLRNLNQLEESASSARRATELKPTLASAHFNLAESLDDLGRDEEALESYNNAIEMNPAKLTYRNDRGIHLMDLGQLDKAFADFQFCAEKNPKESLYVANRGQVWTRRGETEKALEDFAKAINIAPEDDFAYSRRGRLYLEMKQFDNAVDDLKKVTELDPDWTTGWFDLGRACGAAGLLEEAREVYSEGLKRDPKHFGCLCNRSFVSLQLEKYADAKRDSLAAIQLAPMDMDATYNLARAHYNLSEYAMAAQALSVMIGAQNPTASKFSFRGDCFLNLGKYELAVKDYSESLKQDPSDLGVKHARGYTFTRLGNTEKALDDFNSILAADPNKTRTLLQRAHLLRRNDMLGKAIADYEKLLDLDPDNSVAHLNLAAIFGGANDEQFHDAEKSLSHAKRAVELTNAKGFNEMAILSVAYARARSFDKATEAAKESNRLAEQQNANPVNWLREAMHFYAGEMPWTMDLK